MRLRRLALLTAGLVALSAPFGAWAEEPCCEQKKKTTLVAGDKAKAAKPAMPNRGKGQKDPEMAAARSFRGFKLPGEELAPNLEKLVTELAWHDSVEAALAAAKKAGKPVLWIQALGDLDAFT